MSNDGATRAISTLHYKKDKLHRKAPAPLQPGFGAILDDAVTRAAAAVTAAGGHQVSAAERARQSEIALQNEGYIYQQLVAPASPAAAAKSPTNVHEGANVPRRRTVPLQSSKSAKARARVASARKVRFDGEPVGPPQLVISGTAPPGGRTSGDGSARAKVSGSGGTPTGASAARFELGAKLGPTNKGPASGESVARFASNGQPAEAAAVAAAGRTPAGHPLAAAQAAAAAGGGGLPPEQQPMAAARLEMSTASGALEVAEGDDQQEGAGNLAEQELLRLRAATQRPAAPLQPPSPTGGFRPLAIPSELFARWSSGGGTEAGGADAGSSSGSGVQAATAGNNRQAVAAAAGSGSTLVGSSAGGVKGTGVLIHGSSGAGAKRGGGTRRSLDLSAAGRGAAASSGTGATRHSAEGSILPAGPTAAGGWRGPAAAARHGSSSGGAASRVTAGAGRVSGEGGKARAGASVAAGSSHGAQR